MHAAECLFFVDFFFLFEKIVLNWIQWPYSEPILCSIFISLNLLYCESLPYNLSFYV